MSTGYLEGQRGEHQAARGGGAGGAATCTSGPISEPLSGPLSKATCHAFIAPSHRINSEMTIKFSIVYDSKFCICFVLIIF